jgi:hypothetical protein
MKQLLPALLLLPLLIALPETPSPPPIRFRNIAEQAGVRFVVENYPTPEKHLIETMPGGIAAFDYNNDGRTDLYFTNGAPIPSLKKESAKYHNRLFRNDGGMKFSDVTDAAGVAGRGYSMGVAAGDYDNDGDVDLFVAGVYEHILFRNNGDGRFQDVTAKSAIRSDEWAVAAAWFDYDNDGLLDLWIVNYTKWSAKIDRFCGDSVRKLRVYCHPRYFEPIANALYRNRGDGTFEDVSGRTGVAKHLGRGMGAAVADYDGDGYTDVLVTNDVLPNFLFRNVKGKVFEEVALLAGVALPDNGKPISSMGADFRDYDNDGRPDIIIVALFRETFPLFRNLGSGTFSDATYSSKLGPAVVGHSGWGPALADFNNDGWKDLFVSAAHVIDVVDEYDPPAKYREPNRMLVNLGDGSFRDVSAEAGFTVARAHRGNVIADFNNDGKLDIAVSALGEPAELWENVSPGDAPWIRILPQGLKSNRDGIGAEIRAGRQHNHMTTSFGYASSTHAGVHFGNPDSKAAIEVRWPSGRVSKLEGLKQNEQHVVREP